MPPLLHSLLIKISHSSTIRNAIRSLLSSNFAIVRTPALWGMRKLVYPMYCGGERLIDAHRLGRELLNSKIRGMWDFAAEAPTAPTPPEHKRFSIAIKGIHQSVDFAARLNKLYSSDSFGQMTVLKLSSLIDPSLLRKLSQTDGALSFEDKNAILKSLCRIQSVFERASHEDVAIVVDAENSVIQDAIDRIALTYIRLFNLKGRTLVINTYQMYRKDGYGRMAQHLKMALESDCGFGAKVVRGAYMTFERSQESTRPSILHDSIDACHEQYDRAISVLLGIGAERHSSLSKNSKGTVKIIVATHNKQSVLSAIKRANILLDSKSASVIIAYAQLYGMGDELTHLVVRQGGIAYKYVPWGPAELTLPYLIRRLDENQSILNQEIKSLFGTGKSSRKHRILIDKS